MSFLATLQALFQAATAYFVLRNKLAFWDVQEKVDSRIDKMDTERAKLRLMPSADAQAKADNLVSEMIEEKRKLANLKKQFDL